MILTLENQGSRLVVVSNCASKALYPTHQARADFILAEVPFLSPADHAAALCARQFLCLTVEEYEAIDRVWAKCAGWAA
jgi:hypothetical protein